MEMPNREVIDRALVNVISNAMNYPDPRAVMGKDTGPLRKKAVDAVMKALVKHEEETRAGGQR